MEEVEPSKLIPDEFYYLENKTDKTMKAKGKFLYIYEHEKRFGGTQAAFRIVPSKKIKSKKMDVYSNDVRGFPLASYKFYKPLAQNVIDRYQESIAKNPSIAFEKMINQQKLPIDQDKISFTTMFAQTPEDIDPTFYGSEPDKSNIGTQLKDEYGAYLDKKKGGKRRRKTRKSRKTKKSIKSRRIKRRIYY